MRRTIDEIIMQRYLLGDLPQEERARFENRYLDDEDVFEELLVVENDLIDSYVQGALTVRERQQFEGKYLKSRQGREKVAFARDLRQVSESTKLAVSSNRTSLLKRMWTAFSAQQKTPQLVLAFAAIIVLVCGSWLIVRNRGLQNDLHQALAQQAELRGEQEILRQHITRLEENASGERNQHRAGTDVATEIPISPYVTLNLNPGVARSLGALQKMLKLPPTASSVRLNLLVDRDEDVSYHAILRTAEGGEGNLVERKDLKSMRVGNQRAVVLILSAKLLDTQDYIVTLSSDNGTQGAEEEVEAYSFRVVRK